MSESGAALRYRRDIDGLRAVAVLSVAFYHARLPGFGGGFVGVDVFFVISGFLITQIILPEVERDGLSLWAFYERRIRRIFPALFAMVLVVLALGCWLLLPDDLVELCKSVIATVLFGANFHFLSQAGYFDAPSWSKPLLHTWSLAVEEQFYIVFPALLLLARRKLGGRYLALTLGTVIVSLAACIVGTHNFRDADFFLAPTRAWELGAGALLALGAFPALRDRRAREAVAAVGLALIVYAITSYTDDTKFPGVNAIPPVLGATLVLWAGIFGASAVGRLLSTGPAVFVGLISYSLYLWHWPLLIYASYVPARALTVPEACAVLALSGVVATISWRWVERPFRGSRSPIDRQTLFRGAFAVSAATAAIALALAVTGGLPGRVDGLVRGLVATRAQKDILLSWCNFHRNARTAGLWARDLGDPSAGPASFVLWGDSHACMLAENVDALARESGRRGHLASGGGCPPLLLDHKAGRDNVCMTANERVFDALVADPQITDVVLAGRWALYFEGHGYGQERVKAPLEFLEDASDSDHRADVLADMLERTATALAKAGRRVWVVGPVPEVGRDVPAVLARAHMLGRSVDPSPSWDSFLERQASVLPALDRLRGNALIHVLQPHEALCRDGRCQVLRDGHALYWDDDHLSREGVDVLEPLLRPIFATAQAKAPVD